MCGRRSSSRSVLIAAYAVCASNRPAEQPVRVARVDDDQGNLLAVAKPEMCPGVARVGGLVDPVADGQIGSREAFAAADVDDVRVRWRDGNRANRSRRLIVEDWNPRAPEIVRLPDAAVHRRHIEHIWLARHARDRLRAPAAARANRPPAHFGATMFTSDVCARTRPASGPDANAAIATAAMHPIRTAVERQVCCLRELP